MANLLDSLISNTGLNIPGREKFNSNTYSTAGRVKPLEDKAKLLPSKVIGSPIEYVKDFAYDIVSVGKAAKGKANDHELGRINDLGMKAGSLGIASYLFYKNPFKLSKTMEVVGFGSFFASMALWPKLAIGLPIKARTGVDFQQEYIDSQGRKKGLYQDPQYVLTDMLPREDLDNIGKKMGVSENLPDRDSFIKQRAHKTAVQANTLWMMTAGLATPIMTALSCNAAEKVLRPWLQNDELVTTQEECFSNKVKDNPTKKEQAEALKKFMGFIEHNKDRNIDDEIIKKLCDQFDYMIEQSNVPSIRGDVKRVFQKMSYNPINKKLLEKTFGKQYINALPKNDLENLSQYMELHIQEPEKQIEDISKYLSQCDNKVKINGQGKEISLSELSAKQIQEKLTENARTRKLGSLTTQLTYFYESFNKFMYKKITVDKYVNARIGERPDSFIANQWNKVCGKFVDVLNLDNPFTTKEVRQIANGNKELIDEKLNNLVSDGKKKKFTRTVIDLMKKIDRYEQITSSNWRNSDDAMLYNLRQFTKKELNPGVDKNGKSLTPPTSKAHEVFMNAHSRFKHHEYFTELADKFMSDTLSEYEKHASPGTLANIYYNSAENTVSGARSSFYRMILTLDVLKQAQGSALNDKLVENLKEVGKHPDEETLKRLTQICKDVVMKATTTDHVEKLTTPGFELSPDEFKVVMKTIFQDHKDHVNVIEACLNSKNSGLSEDQIKRMTRNYSEYRKEFIEEIGNWINDKTPSLSQYNVNGASNGTDWAKKNNLVGKTVYDTIIDISKNKYNSKKWMQIFGGAMVALTGITVGAGLMFGRKDKIEQQVEEESRKNV